MCPICPYYFRTLKKYGRRTLIGFIWLRIGTDDRLLETRVRDPHGAFEFRRRKGIYQLSHRELLTNDPSELVTCLVG
jgi:hypothetical protein